MFWNMKHFGKIAACLAGSLALNASLRADTVPLTGNPYALVVARNIFGLLPPVAVDTAPPVAEPPVKITLNGIMNVFGQVQAFFKVAGRTPGKEDSYMLTEGQGQDEIEVVKIDEKNGVVTFNNHGLEQVLPLAAAAGSLPTPTGGTGVAGVSGGIPAPAGNFVSSGFNTAFGGRGIAGGNPGTDLRTVPTRNNSFIQQPQTSLSPEEQTVAIEVNREVTKQQVLEGSMPPLPPTELTPPDATSVGGAPLVTPAPTAPPP